MNQTERTLLKSDLKLKYVNATRDELSTEYDDLMNIKLDMVKNARRLMYRPLKMLNAESVDVLYNIADLLVKLQIEIDIIADYKERDDK